MKKLLILFFTTIFSLGSYAVIAVEKPDHPGKTEKVDKEREREAREARERAKERREEEKKDREKFKKERERCKALKGGEC